MMQGWSAPAPSRAQTYNVACSEGHRLRGHRTDGYQALRCPTCGDGIFVLPRSPLPEPTAPASSNRARVAALAPDPLLDDEPFPLTDPMRASGSLAEVEVEAEEAEAEIDWVDDVPAEPEVVRPDPRPTPKAQAPRPKPKPRPAPDPTPPPPPPEPIGPKLAAWARRHRPALISAGVVVLVLMAVGVRRWRARLEELPRIAEIGRTEGIKRLDAGDFHAAKKLLADASDAVDGLGGRYEGAESIRQAAREAAIFTDLSPDSLEDILAKAVSYRGDKGWSTHFANFYKGRAIIIEAAIAAEPDPRKPDSGYSIEYSVLTGRGPRPEARARFDLGGFALFDLSKPKVGEPKTFGARLASLELDVASNEWVFRLEPDSGVFILHPRALEFIGWPAPESEEEPRP